MSIHVCKCNHQGREEFHLRYPGMSEKEAQYIADKINGGALDEFTDLRAQVAELQTKLFAEQAFPKFRFKPYADTDAGLVAQVTELQNELANAHAEKTELQGKLDEIAKQEPVAKAWRGFDGIHFAGSEELSEACGRISADPVRIQLYRLPPNLPAIIEKAKAEVLPPTHIAVPIERLTLEQCRHFGFDPNEIRRRCQALPVLNSARLLR